MSTHIFCSLSLGLAISIAYRPADFVKVGTFVSLVCFITKPNIQKDVLEHNSPINEHIKFHKGIKENLSVKFKSIE